MRLEDDAVIEAALGAGIEWLDTAHAYEGSEERIAKPGAGVRVPPPILVEALGQLGREHRLQLPGLQVASNVEPRIDVSVGVVGAVAKARCFAQALGVAGGYLGRRQLAAVQVELVEKLRAVPSDESQLGGRRPAEEA